MTRPERDEADLISEVAAVIATGAQEFIDEEGGNPYRRMAVKIIGIVRSHAIT